MELKLTILSKDQRVKAESTGNQQVGMVYGGEYEEGDCILLSCSEAGFVAIQLEDTMPQVVGWLENTLHLFVPFGEKKISYSPKSFTGKSHLLAARVATEKEIGLYRNLACNPLDSHENKGFFPHASANVETRGEAVFAARNAINGNHANWSHGAWPFESWGINRQEDAAIRVDFAKPVLVDQVVVTLRADFPHDNWWKQGTLFFSDGSEITLCFEKTPFRQVFGFHAKKVSWVRFSNLIKDETDESPFPALTQIELWGKYVV